MSRRFTVEPVYTEEERKQFEQLEARRKNAIKAIAKTDKQHKAEAVDKYKEVTEKLLKFQKSVTQRRAAEKYNGDKNKIMKDVKLVVSTVTEEEFINAWYDNLCFMLNKDSLSEEEQKQIIGTVLTEGKAYYPFRNWLRHQLNLALYALEAGGFGQEEALKIIETKAIELYGPPPPEQTEEPVVLTNKPKELLALVDKATGIAFNPALQLKQMWPLLPNQQTFEADLFMGTVGGKKVETFVKIDYTAAKTDKPLTDYERGVYLAVVAIYDAGNTFFTDKMVYEQVTGKTLRQLTPKQREDTQAALYKLKTTTISINRTEEVRNGLNRAAAKNASGEYIVKASFLEFREVEQNLRGSITSCYSFIAEPIQYTYAKEKGQLERQDKKFLDVPLNFNKQTTALVYFLCDCVLRMSRTEAGFSRTIIFENIYERLQAVNDEPLHKTQRARIREDTMKILDSWKEKSFIAGYKINTRGRAVTGVEITPILKENAQRLKAKN